MALPTVRQCFCQVGTAVPLSTPLAIRSEAMVRIEQCRPDSHQPALIERKCQIVRGHRIPYRRDTPQVGPYRLNVIVGEIRVGRIGECGIEVSAIGTHALVDRAQEVGWAPGTDASLTIRCDVR